MKKVLLLFVLFITFQGYSQKDSIVTFFDDNNAITKNNINYKFAQIATKTNDSLWLFRRFLRNGRLFSCWNSKESNGKTKTGQFVTFDLNDSVRSISSYNKKGLIHGKFKSWFINRKLNSQGLYLNGNKEGVWKYYHYNGKIAARAFFKKDSLIKEYYYDEEGNEKEKPKGCCLVKAKFKGGEKKFRHKIKKLGKKLKEKLSGKIIVTCNVDVKGEIDLVKISGHTPEYLKKIIVNYFKEIKGWQPMEHLGRKVPSNFSVPLSFK